MGELKKKKVMFVASSGGHFTEILKLKSLFDSYNYVLVTENTVNTKRYDKATYNMEFVKYCSKNNMIEYILTIICNFFIALAIMIKHMPDVIVTTGANTGGTFGIIAKIFGKKVIYIETLAAVNALSGTGKMMYYVADKFYVQWEELAKKYPKSEYVGRLI